MNCVCNVRVAEVVDDDEDDSDVIANEVSTEGGVNVDDGDEYDEMLLKSHVTDDMSDDDDSDNGCGEFAIADDGNDEDDEVNEDEDDAFAGLY